MRMTVKTSVGNMTMDTNNPVHVATVFAQACDDQFSAAIKAAGFKSRWHVPKEAFQNDADLNAARLAKCAADERMGAAWKATRIYG